MKFGVIVFPGSNCDHDMIHVLRNVMQQEVEVLWHKDKSLNNFTTSDCIVLPGGFSYGDYLRSGAIARFSPIMQSVIDFANNGGKVLGICNGFQILCEAGLLPGALLRNDMQKFSCKNVYIKPTEHLTSITKDLEHKAYKIPIAHAEGRYYCDNATLRHLQNENQILFQYCNSQGEVNSESNPNGSLDSIAGVCNEHRNVFGMMPHPERAAEKALGNTDGYSILKSFILNVESNIEIDVIDNLLS